MMVGRVMHSGGVRHGLRCPAHMGSLTPIVSPVLPSFPLAPAVGAGIDMQLPHAQTLLAPTITNPR